MDLINHEKGVGYNKKPTPQPLLARPGMNVPVG